MRNPRLAGRYAKSLIDLAIERNQLEVVYKDALYLQALCKASREFVVILRSPVIKADKKLKIVAAVTDSKVGELMTAFIRLLINKTREANLPEIINAMIDQYNTLKGIHKVKLTTAEAISDTLKESITAKIKNETTLKSIELETDVNPDLIGGFVLEFDNNLVDASIAKELRDIKKQFSKNIYVHQLR